MEIIKKVIFYPPIIKNISGSLFYSKNNNLVYKLIYNNKEHKMELLYNKVWLIGYSISDKDTFSYNIEKNIIYLTNFENDIWNDDIFNIWDIYLGQDIYKYNKYKNNHYYEIEMWQKTHATQYLITARQQDKPK